MKSATFGRSGGFALPTAFVTSAPLRGRPSVATSAVRVGGVGSEVAWLGLLGLPELPGRLGFPGLSGLLELLGLLVLLGLLGLPGPPGLPGLQPRRIFSKRLTPNVF